MDNFVKKTLESALEKKQHSESFKYSKFSPFRKDTNSQHSSKTTNNFPRPPNRHVARPNIQTHQSRRTLRDIENKKKRNICGNCGIQGHLMSDCKQPIQSYGLFLMDPSLSKVLVIQRKDSFGYISLINNERINSACISKVAKTITHEEQTKIICFDFQDLWNDIINNPKLRRNRNIMERNKERFKHFQIKDIVRHIDKSVLADETEWGFPKGRIKRREKWTECAKRETSEEIGVSQDQFQLLSDMPFMENIKGSDGKMYINVYYVATVDPTIQLTFQYGEIRDAKWVEMDTLQQFFNSNQTKKKIIHQVNNFIKTLDSTQ